MSESVIKVFCDGGARGNPGPAACAFAVVEGGETIHEGSKYLGKATNNYAEHYAVLLALKWLAKEQKKRKIDSVNFFLDSELVVNQLSGRYKIKSDSLKPLAIKSKDLERKFAGTIIYNYIPRTKNKLADGLVSDAIDDHLFKTMA